MTSAMAERQPARREFHFTSAAVLAWLLVVYVLPLPPPLDMSIDSSWQASLVEQFLRGAQYGVDLVFTYGPWGFLAEPGENPAIYGWLVSGRLVLALGIALGAAWVSCRYAARRAWRWLWLAVFVLLANAIFLAPCLLYAVLWGPQGRAALPLGWRREEKLVTGVLILACALAAHVKLVDLPLVGLLGLLILFDDLRSRRFPWLALALAGAYAAFYFAAGQRLPSFVPYLRGAVSTVSGYGLAMAFEGPAATAIAGAVLCLAMPLVCLMSSRRDGTRLPGAAWVAAYFLMAFKQGFVRQDRGHLLIGMVTFAIPASLVLLQALPLRWPRLVIFLVVAETAIFGGCAIASGDMQALLGAKWEAIRNFPQVFGGDRARMQAYRQDLEDWRAVYPLPALPGGADILPLDVDTLVVNSAEYRPRPVPQSYAAFTPYLARLNARFLSGPHAPEFVVFGADPLDGHLPGTEDNLAWMTLLTDYQPAGFAGDYLLLRKARDPRPARREKILERTVSWHEDLAVPGPGTVWAEIDVPVTPLGRLLDFFFRPPEVDLNVESGGVRNLYRLVTPLARSGFLLSPVVESPVALALLYQGGDSPRLAPRVSHLALETGAAGKWAFGPALSVRLYGLDVPVRSGPEVFDEDGLRLAGEIRSTAPQAVWAQQPSWRVTDGQVRLEANAPSAGSLPVNGSARQLQVGFGLQNQCDDLPDPRARVEFRVSYRSADGRVDRMLLRRILEAHGTEDATSEATVDLPARSAGRITFAATPKLGNCRIGAYWSQVKLR